MGLGIGVFCFFMCWKGIFVVMYWVFKFNRDKGLFCCIFLWSLWNFVGFWFGEVVFGCLCCVVIRVNECRLLLL